MRRADGRGRGVHLRVRLLVAVGVTGLALMGCGGRNGAGQSPVALAQAEVSAKQTALSEEQAGLASATGAFCTAGASYITAMDRYGDVLHQTAPTVGDVKDAGKDLADPREGALAGAEAAVGAQQEVVAAEKELATAQAALAAAQAQASAGETTAAAPATPKTASAAATASPPAPLAPAATVNRVKQAEADFTAAQRGITDGTPLAQASQQFNAAAVALEMSWLQLFAEAGCLSDDQQKQAHAAVHDYTAALQKSLADAGYYKGEVDGIYGPETVQGVQALQKAHALPVTGTVDKATGDALQADLQAKGGVAAQEAVASTAAVQQTLKLAGFWTGPVDGQWTAALTEALKAFQNELGVKPTGTVDAATIAGLEDAIATAEQKSSPSPTATKTSAPTSTTTPSS
jgi:peptidoglycan hydrolase-like protein with peptidoglycan-binding domain